MPYVLFKPGQSGFKGFVPAYRSVNQKVPVTYSGSQSSPARLVHQLLLGEFFLS